MFITHWLQRTGLAELCAPIHPDATPVVVAVAAVDGDNGEQQDVHDANNDTNANNAEYNKSGEEEEVQEETPIFDLLAPRMPTTTTTSNNNNNNASSAVQTPTIAIPPSNVFPPKSSSSSSSSCHAEFIKCQHCHKMTRVMYSHEDDTTANANTDSHHDNTNHDNDNDGDENIQQNQHNQDQNNLQQLHLLTSVTTAAKLTSITQNASTSTYEQIKKAFDYAAWNSLGGKLSEKKASSMLLKLKKVLRNNVGLIEARSFGMMPIPDGFTLFHVACWSGYIGMVEYLLEEFVLVNNDDVDGKGNDEDKREEEEDGDNNNKLVTQTEAMLPMQDDKKNKPRIDLNERDLIGRTALHIAAERGRVDVIQLLKKAYDSLEQREQEQWEQQEGLLYDFDSDSESDIDDDEVDGVDRKEVASTISTISTSSKTSTSIIPTNSQTTPKTPLKTQTQAQTHHSPKKSPKRSPKRSTTKQLPKSHSPKPPSRNHHHHRSPRPNHLSPRPNHLSPRPNHLSPTFAGPTAPIDLAGRTPFAHAITSNDQQARKNRGALKNILYVVGDKSVVGERTPPRERCGGGGMGLMFSPIHKGGNDSGVVSGNDSGNDGKSGRTSRVSFDTGDGSIVGGTTSSYLSPTPGRKVGRYYTPGGSSGNNTTPFFSPMSTGQRSLPDMMTAEKTMQGEGTMATLAEEEGGECVSTIVPLLFGVSEMNGFRIRMEDAMCCHYPLVPPSPPLGVSISAIKTLPTLGVFGVFDGHGGGSSSEFIAHNFLMQLESHPKWSCAYYASNSQDSSTADSTIQEDASLSSVLVDTCYTLDEKLKTYGSEENADAKNSGTTAIVAVVSDAKIFVANVGDSRCILVKKRRNANEATEHDGEGEEPALVTEDETNSQSAASTDNAPEKSTDDANQSNNAKPWDTNMLEVVALSEDHKPELAEERARIEAAGLSVKTDTVNEEDGTVTFIHRLEISKTDSLGVGTFFILVVHCPSCSLVG